MENSESVDVNELMRRVRAEVESRRSQPPRREASATNGAAAPQSAPPDLAPIQDQLTLADAVKDMGAALPPMSRTRGLKRRLAALVGRVFLRLAQMFTRDQRSYNHAALNALRGLTHTAGDHAGRISTNAGQLAALRRDLSSMAAELARASAAARSLEQRLDESRAPLAELSTRLAEERQRSEALRAEIAALRQTAQTDGATRSNELAAQGKILRDEVLATQRRESLRLGALQTNQLLQDRRLSLLLEEARRRLPEPMGAKELQTFADEGEHQQDMVYLDFEAVFRGSREAIQERVREYVAPLRAAGAGTSQFPIIDLGCGNGELLQVLTAEGLRGVGVDTNRAFLDNCRARKLEVVEADCLAHLRSLPDGSAGAVVAIHMVEHLPFSKVLKLVDEALRVLKPGGVLIFETPNPQNILVGASTFYIDPTHRNPLYPETLRFVLEERGLVRVGLLALHPYEPEHHLPDDGKEITRRFNQLFYGPRDYAAFGYRA